MNTPSDCTLCQPGWPCPWCERAQQPAWQREQERFWATYDARKKADPFYAHGDHGEWDAPDNRAYPPPRY